MGVSPWISCFWPGLPRLWWRGEWSGLLLAAMFGLALNVSLVETFVAPEGMSTGWNIGTWGVLAVFWLICFRRATRRLSFLVSGDGRKNDELFSRAQEEYLRGQWFEAESLLMKLVRDDPADVEGRLLLATVYRHTRRPELARTELDHLERYPQAGRWRWEVQLERSRLANVSSGAAVNEEAPLEATSQPPGGATEITATVEGAPNLAGEVGFSAAAETSEPGIENFGAPGGLSKAA